jgi:hypothetical protein
VLLLISAAQVSADQSKYVEQNNGFDWMNLTYREKVWFVIGYWQAEAAVKEMIFDEWDEQDYEPTQADFDHLDEMFYTAGTVGDLVAEIDRYYEIYNNREFPIWQVIMMIKENR